MRLAAATVLALLLAGAASHPGEYAEFARKDAAGAYTNKHAIGWTRMNVDRDLIAGEEAKLRGLETPYDAGFTAKGLVAGKKARFDASRLLKWGNASPNTFAWWFGDGSSEGTVTAAPGVARATHVYARPGTYKVRLTCSDSDFVNDAAQPLLNSGLRTTTMTIKVTKK